MRATRVWIPVASLGTVVLAGISFLAAQPRSRVDFGSFPVVAVESDDWGLAGFVPHPGALAGVDRERLAPGRFPPVYWGSTLEDSAQVAALCDLLDRHRGRDGRPAVLQANYVLGSLQWERSPAGWAWRRRFLPDVAPGYGRPGLWRAVADGVAAGVWRPEYHALWHYDPQRRQAAVAADGQARLAAENGVMIFPGSERAWELGPWRPLQQLQEELAMGLSVFAALFGRAPESVIAPDYTWEGRCEGMWARAGLRTIQAKREQRYPGLGGGWSDRAQKVLRQRWDLLRHADRLYLQRNCRFEPVQGSAVEGAVLACAQEVRRAWRRRQPAIVESHRINFAHTDSAVTALGLRALDRLLTDLQTGPGGPPYYLADAQIAQLMRRGTCLQDLGGSLIVHNPSHGARILPLPAAAGGAGRWVLAPGRSIMRVGPDGVIARPLPAPSSPANFMNGPG